MDDRTDRQLLLPLPLPAPTSSITGTNGTNSTSTGYSARRVVRTTHYVLGIARRAEPSESPTKSRSACPDSGASDDMHHDRDSFETYTELKDSWVAMGNGAIGPSQI